MTTSTFQRGMELRSVVACAGESQEQKRKKKALQKARCRARGTEKKDERVRGGRAATSKAGRDKLSVFIQEIRKKKKAEKASEGDEKSTGKKVQAGKATGEKAEPAAKKARLSKAPVEGEVQAELPADGAEVALEEELPSHLVGQKVRVIEESAGIIIFGKEGVVENVFLTGEGQVMVKVRGLIANRLSTVLASVVQEVSAFQARVVGKSLRLLTKLEGQNWLEELHMGCTSNKIMMEAWLKELNGTEDNQVGSHTLKLAWRHLTWSLQMSDDRIRFVDPELLAQFQAQVEALEANSANSAARRIVRRLAKIMATIIKGSDLLLLPVNAGGHWTLLVCEGTTTGGVRLRYYDTLQIESDLCREKALSWVVAFGLGDTYGLEGAIPPVEGWQLPARRNFGRQEEGSNQCGYCIMWYVEEEVRHFRGEGWAGRGNLKGPAVRRGLHTLVGKLLPWQADLLESQKEFEEYVKKVGAKKDDRSNLLRLMHQETMLASHEQGRTALEELTLGVEGLPPLLVIPSKPKMKAKAKDKIKRTEKGEVVEPMPLDCVGFEAPSLAPLPLPIAGEAQPLDDADLTQIFAQEFLQVIMAEEKVPYVEAPIWKDELKKPPLMTIEDEILQWADSRLADLPEDCRRLALMIRAEGLGACSRCEWTSGSSEL